MKRLSVIADSREKEMSRFRDTKVLISLSIVLTLFCVFFFPIVSATIPIIVTPLNSSGYLQPSTSFSYTFNFSNDSSCSNVLLSYSENITTNRNGVALINISDSSLSGIPLYMCEYRNDSLRKVHNISSQIFGNVTASYFIGDGSQLTGLQTDSFWTNNSGSITYSAGKVGIGTSSPTRELSVYKNDSTSYVSIQSSTSGIAGLLLGDIAADYFGGIRYDNSDESLGLYTSGSKVFTLKSSNVGVGSVTSPSVNMVIRSRSSDSATRLYLMPYGNASTELNSGIKMFGTDFIADGTNYNDFGLWAGDNYNYINSKQSGTGVARDFIFTYNDGADYGSGTDLMIIKMDGNVGIGTTSPGAKLEVSGITNSTSGFAVGEDVGLSANYSVGECWMAYSGGIMYETNCTSL